MRPSIRVSILSALAILVSQSAYSDNSKCVYDSYRSAVARIDYVFGEYKESIQGSGVLVHADGYVLTARHVVTPPEEILSTTGFPKFQEVLIRFGSSTREPLRGRVVARSSDSDLALIKISPLSSFPKPVPISSSAPREITAPLTAIGFPNGALSVESGRINSRRPVEGGEVRGARIATSIDLSEGFSGGPVFGSNGTLIGIASETVSDNSVGYMVPIELGEWLLDEAGVDYVQRSSCAVFPACRSPAHGIERYEVDEVLTGVPGQGEWSSRSRHGKNSKSQHCRSRMTNIQAFYPDAVLSDPMGEFDEKDGQYKYRCRIRVKREPIFVLKQSSACAP